MIFLPKYDLNFKWSRLPGYYSNQDKRLEKNKTHITIFF